MGTDLGALKKGVKEEVVLPHPAKSEYKKGYIPDDPSHGLGIRPKLLPNKNQIPTSVG